MNWLASLLFVLGASAAAPQELNTHPEIRVEATIDDDDIRCSIRAESAPLDKLLQELAAEIGYEIEGFELARRPALVTVELKDRSLDRALEFVVGSVGMDYQLRRGTITILPSHTTELDRRSLLDLASAAYLRAMTRYPDHPRAPASRLDQGKVAELRGYPGAALDHYQSLIENYPNAPTVPEAYMRSGRLLASLGRWADAAGQFRTLGNLEVAAEYVAPARRELARCTVELGDPQSAVYLLASLDASHPVRSGPEYNVRELVRAFALVGIERYLEALRTLESVEDKLSGEERTEALRVRALALQGAGHPGDAGHAWLLYSEHAQGLERENALEQAAKLALESNDEVGTLFVCRQAERHGFGSRLERYRLEAYARLGFATDPTPQKTSAADRIAQAEAALAENDFDDAEKLIQGLVPGAGALDDPLHVRISVVWAKCLDRREGFESALEYLHNVRASFRGDDALEPRARLDVTAADLLETNELFDRAADAYRGIY